VEVTQHKETPGVGTRAMTDSYLKQYIKHPVGKPIRLKKDGGDIDAVSGATRSSTAIADAVDHAASFVFSHKDQIIRQILSGHKEVSS
jgi:electron transport complex protein RnfG